MDKLEVIKDKCEEMKGLLSMPQSPKGDYFEHMDWLIQEVEKLREERKLLRKAAGLEHNPRQISALHHGEV